MMRVQGSGRSAQLSRAVVRRITTADWANADGKLVVAADYVTDARRAVNRAVGREGTFAESSEGFALDADGEGPISDVMRTGQPQFVADPARSKMTRRDLAEKYGIAEIAFFPCAPRAAIEPRRVERLRPLRPARPVVGGRPTTEKGQSCRLQAAGRGHSSQAG